MKRLVILLLLLVGCGSTAATVVPSTPVPTDSSAYVFPIVKTTDTTLVNS